MNGSQAAIVSIQPNQTGALLALRVSLQPNAAVDVTTVPIGAVRHAFFLFLCEESEARSCLVASSPPHASSSAAAAAAAVLAMINTVTIL